MLNYPRFLSSWSRKRLPWFLQRFSESMSFPRISKNFSNFLFGGAVLLAIFYFLFSSNSNYDYQLIPEVPFCDRNSYSTEKFITFPFLTIRSNAGLGNQLFETMSLIGIADHLNRTPMFNSQDLSLISNLDLLYSNLPNLTFYIQEKSIDMDQAARFKFHVACCVHQWNRLLDCEQSKFLVIDSIYFQSFKYFDHIGNRVRDFFPANPENIAKTSSVLNQEEENQFKTCVHVRRGDFLTDGMHEGTDENFTINAMEFLQKKNGGVFIIFSNDPDWVESKIAKRGRNIKVLRSSEHKVMDDLIFSKIWCDSFLITAPSSTFGWWLAYLSKNMDHVYYRDIFETDDLVRYQMVESDFYPAKWRKMGWKSKKRIFLHN